MMPGGAGTGWMRFGAGGRPGGQAAGIAAVLVAAGALLAAPAPADGAFEREWPDARSATAVGAVEPWATRLLTSGAPGRANSRWSCVFSGGELFALREARWASAQVALDGDPGRYELRVSTFGSPLYAERAVGLSVGRPVADGVILGVRARAVGVAADGCRDVWCFAVDATVAARVTGRLLVGGRFENVGGGRIGGSPVASRAVLGAALALDGLTLEAGARVEDGFDAAPLVSAEAALGGSAALRLCADTGPGTFGLGLGVVTGRGTGGWMRPSADVAWWWHPELGVSSCVSVGFSM